jgi:hypothetical protein
MEQKINKDGKLEISIFDITDKSCEDKFLYFYLALDRNVKKMIENAFIKAYTQKLLQRDEPNIIHKEENGITHIEVHPNDILTNIEIIKRIVLQELQNENQNHEE